MMMDSLDSSLDQGLGWGLFALLGVAKYYVYHGYAVVLSVCTTCTYLVIVLSVDTSKPLHGRAGRGLLSVQ